MELKKAILERRSIRKYKDKPVKIEILGEILDVARFSPSSGNLQNWQFIIVTNEKKKKEIASASMNQNWMTEAPAYIVICNQYKKVTQMYGKLGKMYSIQNCSIIANNIMLLAKEKGLDTCWIGAFDNEAVQRILEISDDDADPEIILTIGYSNETKLNESEREEIQSLVYFDKWGKKTTTFAKSGIVDKVKGFLKK
jgi:nitroreductase